MKVKKLIALLLAIVLAVTPMMGTVFAEEATTESQSNLYLATGNNAAVFLYTEPVTFTDIRGHWANEYIRIATLAKYMNGVGNQKFAPNDTVSRAMVAQVLYNLAGKPAINSYNPFKDVKSSDWYYKAVCWAYNKKITTGTSSTTFDPNAPVTREQMVTFLYRYVNFRGYSLKGYGYDDNLASLNKFSDKGQVSSFAKDAITWALGNHVVNGKSENTLAPRHSATRAELAKIIVMFALTTQNPQSEMFARSIASCDIKKDDATTQYYCKYSVPNLEDYYKSVFESCGISFGQYHGKGTHYRFFSDSEPLGRQSEGAFGPLLNVDILDGSYSENSSSVTTEGIFAVTEAGTINDIIFSQKYGLSSSVPSSCDDVILDGILYSGRSTVILNSLLMQDVLLSYAEVYANAIKSFCLAKGHSGKIYITNYQLFMKYYENITITKLSSTKGEFYGNSYSYVNCNISFFVE